MVKAVVVNVALLLSLLLWPQGQAFAHKATVLKQMVRQYDQRFVQVMRRYGIPGGAYAIVHGNQVVAVKGHGTRILGKSLPVNGQTVFRLASVSKTFTAGLAAVLQQDNLLRWDAPVINAVDGVTLRTVEPTQSIRLDHLLSHTSGFTPHAYDNLINDGWSLSKIYAKLSRLTPLCSPGRCYGYQNVLFSLIQPLIKRATGHDYESLLDRRLFKPLAMKHASVGLSGFNSARNKAWPHIRSRKRWTPTRLQANYYRINSAAGINASAADLAQWMIAHLGGYRHVISPTMVDEVTRPRVRTRKAYRHKLWRHHVQDAHYGLGWRIFQWGDDKLIYHGGWVEGYRAAVSFSREHNFGLAVLINAESEAVIPMLTQFWTEVFN